MSLKLVTVTGDMCNKQFTAGHLEVLRRWCSYWSLKRLISMTVVPRRPSIELISVIIPERVHANVVT